MHQSLDVIIVGAGLSGSLLAWTLQSKRPDLKLLLLEAQQGPLSPKTWSFHGGDWLGSEELLTPLICRQWSAYSVHFPSQSRVFHSGYFSIRPACLQQKMKKLLQNDFRLGARVQEVSSEQVRLADGSILQAACVIDARGLVKSRPLGQGFQKFLGLRLRLKKPHHLTFPILMDAKLPQLEGFRFMYILPWSENELLVEDTRYSGTSQIDVDHFQQEVLKYCAQRGWLVQEILEVEKSALPIPFGPASSLSPSDVPCIGVSGDHFHPVTGYSFAEACRLAQRLSDLPQLNSQRVLETLNLYQKEKAFDQEFFFLLNRMLFQAAEPSQRIQIFERFYKLPEPLIHHFYSGRLSWAEKLRLLSGKPPVPIGRAIRSALGGWM